MTHKSATFLICSAFLLAACSPAPVTSTLPAPTTPEGSAATYASGADPDFGAKCIQRIRASLANPYDADISLSGEGYELQARVKKEDADDGEAAYLEYVCKRDENRAVTAKLISD